MVLVTMEIPQFRNVSVFSAQLGSTTDTCTASVYRAFEEFHTVFSWWTLGDDFMFVSLSSAELGSTADTCTASVCRAFEEFHTVSRGGLWEMTSCLFPYPALSLVRQRIHALRQSAELLKKLTYFPRAGGLWEMTSGLSPYSALSLVRQRIHALRHSTELFEEAHIFSTCRWTLGDDFRIVSVFSAELGSTADTCTASLHGAF